MYNNPYFNSVYNPVPTRERIDNQIAELQKLKEQIPQSPITQPTNLTQNFQLAPNNLSTIRYANSIDDVNKELVIGDTPFFSKDLSVMWLKNINGEVKAYELKEIIQKDEKDLLIDSLLMQIDDLKKGIEKNAKSNNDDVDKSTENKKPSTVQSVRAVKKK